MLPSLLTHDIASQSPFTRLPDELISLIFLHCLPPSRPAPPAPSLELVPLSFTLLSKHLRSIAISTPALWTSITLRLDMSVDPYVHTLNCITHSGVLPLNVHVTLFAAHNTGARRGIDRVQLALLELRDHFHRCATFAIAAGPPYTVRQFLTPLFPPLLDPDQEPSLTSWSLPSVSTSVMNARSDSRSSSPSQSRGVYAPNLRELSISAFASPDVYTMGTVHAPRLHTLRLAHAVPALTTRSLESARTLDITLTASLLRRQPFKPFLESFSNLTACVLRFQPDYTADPAALVFLPSNNPSSPSQLSSSSTIDQYIHLPHLLTLEIADWRWSDGPSRLLLVLHAPVLRALAVHSSAAGNTVRIDFAALIAPRQTARAWDPATLRALRLTGVDLLPHDDSHPTSPPRALSNSVMHSTGGQYRPPPSPFVMFMQHMTNLRSLEISHLQPDIFHALTPRQGDPRATWPCPCLTRFIARPSGISAVSFLPFVNFVKRRVAPLPHVVPDSEPYVSDIVPTIQLSIGQKVAGIPAVMTEGEKRPPEREQGVSVVEEDAVFLTHVYIARSVELGKTHVTQLENLMKVNTGLSLFMDSKLVWTRPVPGSEET